MFIHEIHTHLYSCDTYTPVSAYTSISKCTQRYTSMSRYTLRRSSYKWDTNTFLWMRDTHISLWCICMSLQKCICISRMRWASPCTSASRCISLCIFAYRCIRISFINETHVHVYTWNTYASWFIRYIYTCKRIYIHKQMYTEIYI